MFRTKKPQPAYTADTPDAAAYRGEQADIDCDIEGMAKNARISKLADQWRAEGVSKEEFTRRLLEALQTDDLTHAAE